MIQRRDFLKSIFLPLIFRNQSPTPPNILLLCADDLNTLPFYHSNVNAPSLTALMQRGTTFANCHCQAPLCGPSRASALTGLYPHNTGIYEHGPKFRDVLPAVTTLPQYFQQAGYYTAANGKVFHPTALDANWYDAQSWDQYDLVFSQIKPDLGTVLNGFNPVWDWGPINGDYGDDQVRQASIDFINNPPAQPWLLAAGFTATHVPWYVPWPHYSANPLSGVKKPLCLDGDMDDIPPAGLAMAAASGMSHADVIATGRWLGAMRCYMAAITHLDYNVGLILDALDASGQADNTIVCLWSDHGMHLGEKEHWSKFTLWRESTNVPLIIAGPGVPVIRIDEPVGNVDLLPMLMDLAGIGIPGGLDGVSLAPLLRGEYMPEREILTYHGAENVARTTRQRRRIEYENGDVEEYNRLVDVSEWVNEV